MVGLAAGPIGKTDHSMLVPYLFESGQIPFAVFQLDLADKDLKEDQSRVIFGGTSLYSNQLKWISVISGKHWVVQLDSVTD